jgi:hypothetical protein
MKTTFLKSVSIFFALILLVSFDLPKGWITSGNKVSSYEMGIAKGEGRNGGNCATIKSIEKKIKGFGTLLQDIIAEPFHGKKIKLTVYMKTQKGNIHK